jgi:hypothetical protein
MNGWDDNIKTDIIRVRRTGAAAERLNAGGWVFFDYSRWSQPGGLTPQPRGQCLVLCAQSTIYNAQYVFVKFTQRSAQLYPFRENLRRRQTAYCSTERGLRSWRLLHTGGTDDLQNDARIFQNSSTNIEILEARSVICWRNVKRDTVENLVATATWHQGLLFRPEIYKFSLYFAMHKNK